MPSKRKLVAAALAALAALAFAPSGATTDPCTSRLLVLSAFPGEMDKLITSATLTDVVVVDGRPFFVGSLRGNDVVLALTGIGLVNADRTTRTALETFRCGSATAISGIVFSGVSGGRVYIGDVTVVDRWTIDDGATWFPADPEMIATAKDVGPSVELARVTPLGDPACVGIDPDLVKTITMPHQPELLFGGDGTSADPFGGRTFPCLPAGNDVFGCVPCRAPRHTPTGVLRLLRNAAPFVDPDFFLSYFRAPPATRTYDAEDMETAAVARVAAMNGIPFIAFRALSDGLGDPLHLPGFPVQFFVYRQLAADNAATAALAFLQAWANH